MRNDCDAYYLLWFDYTWVNARGSSGVDGSDEAFVCNAYCAFDNGHWYPLNSNYYTHYGTRPTIGELFFYVKLKITVPIVFMRIERGIYFVSWYSFGWFRLEYNTPAPVDCIDDAIVCNINCLFDIGDWYLLNAGAYLEDVKRVPVNSLFFTQKNNNLFYIVVSLCLYCGLTI